MTSRKFVLLGALLSLLGGCQGMPQNPLPLASSVDLPRFMGDWYVIAFIPILLEKDAHNAVETYRLTKEGHVDTSYRFREGSYAGPLKEYQSTGFIKAGTGNAVWAVQFFWPFKADYRVMYVDENSERTVIGREKRDYVWIMARTPTISDADYQAMLQVVAEAGYDPGLLRKVPQRWPEQS